MQILYWTVPFKCTERVFCQNSQANILQFKLTMNCSRPAALLMRGMRGLTGVSEASQISQGLVKHSLNWPLGPAQCKVKILGESWNLASTVHLAEFIYCTGALAARPGQCPREISADRPWPEWIDPGNGQSHSVLTAPLGAIVTLSYTGQLGQGDRTILWRLSTCIWPMFKLLRDTLDPLETPERPWG